MIKLPAGVAFVRADWVARSIARQQLQPHIDYVPGGLAAVPLPQPEAPEPAAEQDQPGDQQAQRTQLSSRPPAAPRTQQPEGQPSGGPAPATVQPSSSETTQPLSPGELAAAQQDVQQGPAPHCRVARQASEFVAVQGVKPRFTGGDTGILWGTAGVWDEPYDEEAARWATTPHVPPPAHFEAPTVRCLPTRPRPCPALRLLETTGLYVLAAG